MKKINLLALVLLAFLFLIFLSDCGLKSNTDKIFRNSDNHFTSLSSGTLVGGRISDSVSTEKWDWDKNNEHRDFSITAHSIGDSIFFSYCAVFNDGGKVDCADYSQYNFKIAKGIEKKFEIPFVSFYTNTKGFVSIEYLDNGTLLWQIRKKPDGDFFCPENATLIKQQNR